MDICKDLTNIKKFKKSNLTIGSFDGMHQGHMKIINELKRISQNQHIPTVVVTFDPYPQAILNNKMDDWEVLTTNEQKIKIFNASSAQIFGNNKDDFYNEFSKIAPSTPYAVSKASGYWLTKIFRENYDLYACSGILFNHESPLRRDEFVTKKIINVSKQIKKNNKVKLRMGNIDVYRDWGWAPEYVKAMWLMLQQKQPIDLIIGSGKKYSIRDFVNEVFKKMKIDKKNLITGTNKLIRKIDIQSYRANTVLCKKTIKWETKITFKKIIHKMINDELH